MSLVRSREPEELERLMLRGREVRVVHLDGKWQLAGDKNAVQVLNAVRGTFEQTAKKQGDWVS